MKRTNLLPLLALGTLAALAVFSQADAVQTTKTYLYEPIPIYVIPSPAPVVMRRAPRAEAPPARSVAVAPAFARLVADPYAGPSQFASSGSAWDVAPSGLMIAQAVTAQPTPVPVRFNAKPNPNSIYLHIVPNGAVSLPLQVPYGTSTWPCVFQVFTYYPTSHFLTDWALNTTNTAQTGTFPMMNYPTVSYLSWAVPDFAATFHAYANSGSPGERTWSGTAGQTQQHCVDLKIVVPNTQASGNYTAWAVYSLIVS
ncbi:MAG: hypothetical protein JWO85_1502 [Candidatus Eremiobacteraeota bacterium]|nr:hypothetical protein [Candidatus Eremiobacteraeota bacterium]